MTQLSPALTKLVNQTVSTLGFVIKRELGVEAFSRIEKIRKQMAELRKQSNDTTTTVLRKTYSDLETLSPSEQLEIANAFTLMLELINACENAYRSHRLSLKNKSKVDSGEKPKVVIYVLTAHPTEARSPKNIEIFHQIQAHLISVLASSPRNAEFSTTQLSGLQHLIEIALKISIVRNRKPTVGDEAEHIYKMLLRDEVIFDLLETRDEGVPVYIRTWVGGDKDGHPGVDEKVMLESLTLSRDRLIQLILRQMKEIRATIELTNETSLIPSLSTIEKKAYSLRTIETADAKRILSFKKRVHDFSNAYADAFGSPHPNLVRIRSLLHAFPALVVPLELRESSDVLMSKPKGTKYLAIERMLRAIARISKGGDPKWYARGLIISMTESFDHIRKAAQIEKLVFGDLKLPVIPLFEEARTLKMSDSIMAEMLSDKSMLKAIRENWSGHAEMMVGYSDSAKEAGVLASRLAIAEALPKLEKVCERAKVEALFFHGSGGSVSRGGGSIEDQTAWWPKSALRSYKVTVQGEMIDRSLATREIAKRQIQKIIHYTSAGLKKAPVITHNKTLDEFAGQISKIYRDKIHADDFLEMVEAATTYSYLNVLKIGSRPNKRTKKLTVAGLRAIPWVLCWTQTRILFPIWFGVGSAWKNASPADKKALRKAYKHLLVFNSYVKALGFTLAKIEMPIWRIYLEQSRLTKDRIDHYENEFQAELKLTFKFYRELTGEKDLLWFRPWLGESIFLRSPMIHPLNLLQILAKQRRDVHLIRMTMTGISCGMLTTG